MLQVQPQEFDFNFSIYISSDDEEARKELAARPLNKEVLIKAMNEMNLEGEWRITQTACGMIVSFMKEEDLDTFQEQDISGVLGFPASSFVYSALETYRQRMVIRDLPSAIDFREVETALARQGVQPLFINRTRAGNVSFEIADPVQFNSLLQFGLDFFASGRFAVLPLPYFPHTPMPPPATPRDSSFLRDSVLQCYKCQGFWHYAAQCPAVQRCVRCGDNHPVSECPRPRNDPVCVHCAGKHHAAYKNCPVRLQMKAIVPMTPIYLPGYVPPPPYNS
uniref:CCHC-type domain-containing protein n=1 Tax=Graphocephala atropunctata TaxID=36148 RepID=A0A1B6MKG4_9HEMI